MDSVNISLIFLSIALTSKDEPSDKAEILDAYDYINKWIPTDEEFNTSIGWLLNEGLIYVVDEKYTLSEKGEKLYKKTSKTSKNGLHSIREELEMELTK